MTPENLRSKIREAFDPVPRPARESITSCNCWECTEIRDDFCGLLGDEKEGLQMDYHCWDLGFMTAEARHYFLPAWLHLAITEREKAYAEALLQAFCYDTGWDPPGGYSPLQKEAIAAFLHYLEAAGLIHDWPEFHAAMYRWTDGADD